MTVYRAYGLNIESEFEIPELAAALGECPDPDVRIRFGSIPSIAKEGAEDVDHAIRLSDREFLYSKSKCGRFLVRDGREIEVDPDAGTEARVYRLSLFGPALALILIQRGYLVLHGGAVAFSGGTVILLGPAGTGKSTLTAELCKIGGKLLSDDVVAIDLKVAPPVVVPGVPLLKLWPDAVDSAPDGVWTKLLHPDFDKLGRRMDDSALSPPSPVARIFFLGGGEELDLVTVAGAQAFHPLMASLFAVRFGEGFMAGMDGRDLLAKFSQLASSSPIEILRRPSDRGLLRETAEMIAAIGNDERTG
jgi:hypothetical protein